MRMIDHKVVLHGAAVRKDGISPSAAGSLLLRLENSLRGAVDVAFRRSSSSGRRKKWLRRAAEVELEDVERLGKDEMAFYFSAPRFADVAEEYYAQPSLFDDGPSPDDTAFDVLNDAVEDVLAGKRDSDKFDLGLLKRFQKFESCVFHKEVDELLISRESTGSSSRISLEFPRHARELYLRTPQPTRARVAGRLDMIQASTLAFALVLPGGEKVRGVWKGDDFETLRELVNTDVVATGIAVYRPSAALLRIDAESLTPQRDADRFFTVLPVPSGGTTDLKSMLREQAKCGGMAGIWGQLPAEESDDEFLAALAELD